MSFVSTDFLIFFPLVVFSYFLLPHRFRWILLLAASYVFYMYWRKSYVLLLLVSTAVDYLCSLKMGSIPDKQKRRPYLIVSLAANLGLLALFKYYNFASNEVYDLLGHFGVTCNRYVMDVALPVGISFYTFQTMGYSIDVYRGERKAEKRLGIFALYVAFFPQLVAGPIERSTRLLPQLDAFHKLDYKRVTSGLRLMMWGFFKKCVIADRLAILVDQVYKDPQNFNGPILAGATVLFAFQIYSDFSGYTDIAIGAARVLGIDLMKNFDRPYHASSVRDFWRRWHISLSTWFRDYLYIPLGGNRRSRSRLYFNLLVVFFLCGLWHGANSTFVMWGLLHGLYLVCSVASRGLREKGKNALGLAKAPGWLAVSASQLYVFALVCFAWIFFRANSLADAWFIVAHLADGWSGVFSGALFSMAGDDIIYSLIISVPAIVLMELVETGAAKARLIERFMSMPLPLRWATYYAMIFIIVVLGEYGQIPFIYFQF